MTSTLRESIDPLDNSQSLFSLRRLIIALTVIAFLAGVVAIQWRLGSFEYRKERYVEIIARINSGGITVGPTGVVALPRDLAAATADGCALASRTSGGQLLIAFSTWRGKGANMEGYLYCAQPLTPTEIHIDSYGDSAVEVGFVELVLGKQIDPNWYEVSRLLD